MSEAFTFQPNPALKMAREKAKSEFRTLKQLPASAAKKNTSSTPNQKSIKREQRPRQK